MAAQQKSDSKQSKTSSPKRQAAKPAPVASALEQSPMEMEQAIDDPGAASPSAILQLQRVAGNRAVQRLLASRKAQAKLTVGPAGDKYEREADRVAAEVMRSSEPTPPPVQRQKMEEDEDMVQKMPLAAPSAPVVQREVNLEAEQEVRKLAEAPRSPGDGFEAGSDVESRLTANSGSGNPLPEGARSFMESRFGTDFSGVRVHTGGEAVQLSREMSAQAFTHGSDIYFGEGKYDPDSGGGRQLLAHELTHVVQQGAASASQPVQRLDEEDEVQRELAAEALSPVAGLRVQRDDDDDDEDDDDDDSDIESESGEAVDETNLTPGAAAAFGAATKANAVYSQPRTWTASYMPKPQQKKLVDLKGFFQRLQGAEKDLKNLIGAFLLKEYATRLNDLQTDTRYDTPVAKAKARDKKYFPKALEVRDKYKPLLKKGVAAPETQAFLKSEGLESGVQVTEELKTQELAKGPRIDVRSTFIGGKILGISLRAHLFVVYTSAEGKQWYFRGGPDEDGFTVADMGDYAPGTVDWDPSAPSKTVMTGEAAKEKLDGLMEATSAIDAMKVPYVAVKSYTALNGENCNATAWTILDRAGVPKNKPFGLHPGWGHQLGEYLKQGQNKIAPKEDSSGPGRPYIVEPAKGDSAQVYRDRGGVEKLATLPDGTPVEVLKDIQLKNRADEMVKIRFGGGTIGYVEEADVELPREKGRAFKLAGAQGELVAIDEVDQMPQSRDILDGGDDVEGVAPGCSPGGASVELIKIRYVINRDERLGRVVSTNLVETGSGTPPPLFTPERYPAGSRKIPVTANLTLKGADKPDGTLNYDLEYDPTMEKEIDATVKDDLTVSCGRAEVKYWGTTYYVPLDSLFAPLDVEPEDETPKNYDYINDGNYPLVLPAGKKLNVFASETAEESTENTFERIQPVRLKVYSMAKEHGRCRMEIMGTGLAVYVALEDVFTEDGQPSATIDRAAPTTEEEVSVLTEAPPEPTTGVEEGTTGEQPGASPEQVKQAYERVYEKFNEMSGLDLAIIMSGSVSYKDLKLALSYSPDAAETLAATRNGEFTADDLIQWAK
jgi:hypothetical protein